jgi:hypothetical protein
VRSAEETRVRRPDDEMEAVVKFGGLSEECRGD